MGDLFVSVAFWTGVVTLVGAAIVAACALAVLVWVYWFGPFGPMLHFGAPKLECRLCFYGGGHIITLEDATRLSEEAGAKLPKPLNHWFSVPWFAGLSTRKGHFLIGVLRLVRHP